MIKLTGRSLRGSQRRRRRSDRFEDCAFWSSVDINEGNFPDKPSSWNYPEKAKEKVLIPGTLTANLETGSRLHQTSGHPSLNFDGRGKSSSRVPEFGYPVSLRM